MWDIGYESFFSGRRESSFRVIPLPGDVNPQPPAQRYGTNDEYELIGEVFRSKDIPTRPTATIHGTSAGYFQDLLAESYPNYLNKYYNMRQGEDSWYSETSEDAWLFRPWPPQWPLRPGLAHMPDYP